MQCLVLNVIRVDSIGSRSPMDNNSDLHWAGHVCKTPKAEITHGSYARLFDDGIVLCCPSIGVVGCFTKGGLWDHDHYVNRGVSLCEENL